MMQWFLYQIWLAMAIGDSMKINRRAIIMYKKKRAQSLDAAPLDQARGVFRDRANRSGLTAWAGCVSFSLALALYLLS